MALDAVDRLPVPRGRLSFRVYDGADLVEEYSEPNLVVGGARRVVAGLLGGSPGLAVSHIGFGVGSSAPALADVALTGAVFSPVLRVEFPAPGAVRFVWELGAGLGNGMQVTEFGLYAADGTLVARKVRPVPINKTSKVSVFGAWVLSF